MTVTRVKVNKAAFRELRKSVQVRAKLLEVGEKLAADANADHEATADIEKNGPITEPGYEAQPYVGKNRARVSVVTATPRAMGHEQRTSSLLRAAAKQ